MKALGQYILSITSAAMIFGTLKSLLGGKGTSAILLQLVGGLFLAFTIVTPIADIDFDKIFDIQNDYVTKGDEFSVQGSEIAHTQFRNIIKQRSEAYILDKALAYQTPLEVEVVLSSDNIPVPATVCMKGSVSPYVKNSLQVWLEDNMGIPRENQIWIG